MATYNVSASAVLTDLEVDVWGAELQSGDTVCVYNGATLTVDVSRPFLIIKCGESSAGDPGAGQRTGHLTINDGLTMTADGNATITNSGFKSSPAATDNPGTKSNLLTIGAGCTFTNSVGAYNANNKWCINWAWGMVSANVAFTMKYCGGNTETWILLNGTSQSAATSHVIGNLTLFIGGVGGSSITIFTLATSNDIPFSAGFITADCTGVTANSTFQMFFGGRVGTVECSIKGFRTINMPAGRIMTFNFNASAQTAANLATSAMRVEDNFVQCTEVTPADFALTNMQDGSAKATVSNIASIALTDTIVVFDSSNNRLASLTRAEYAASSGRKDANCILIEGLALAANNGLYCKYTTDNFVYGPASGTANVTPTYTPAVSAVSSDTQYGKSGTEFTGTRPLGNKRLSFGI